ncbi:CocE/NonD family hydrolase [Aliiroseovarius lamellibrachiae]|uniref:CocE/NonD family hydrolase n=1 Tax=Aliiroseovarius lamellibrachiae TaxID=1924933 RepID=UPI001BE078D0|nr:CocE/NonD family hydrolase [Aliiroseovarius lamellibrachiae]MBT2132431.1 CocE/NonD family hydrolase [Aliiroseovarius lamellibrachiae]
MTNILEIEIDHDLAIPLPDGTRLSAKVWRPKEMSAPLPAIVEYLPYRKSDGTAARDMPMHSHFAAHGYVCLRVDRRGCGDSEGLFDDEYSPQELQDGVDILNWIAAQDWCTGKIGMQGISWGGFNALQIAALAPEPLKAIITIGSTVDRYADDIHYKGGIQVGENIGWAATSTSWFSMPPDPEIVGKSWREMWLERLENTPFLAREWMLHPTRDAYWKHGSICEAYSAIKAPVLAMGGLHDGYRNTMAHLVENLSSPVKAIAGPWSHKYPHISTIAPSIDYLGEALRWWDHWLKGLETGVENDPAYRAYVMDSTAPDPSLSHREGRWVAEEVWPAPAITPKRFDLGDGTLGHPAAFTTQVTTDLTVGKNAGEYFPFGFGPGELPDDQTEDDARSTCFDSDILTAPTDIVGAPMVRLTLSSAQPEAQIIVRLCDLRPDGTSAFISFGLLNLQFRDGFADAKPLEPGKPYEVALTLDQTAYHLPAGHRLRVAVSGSYWPYCWPEGTHNTLTLTAGSLEVPCRPQDAQAVASFSPPRTLGPAPTRQIEVGEEARSYRIEDGQIVLELKGDHGRQEDLDTGLVTQSAMRETWKINPVDPASAEVEIIWNRELTRGDWSVSSRVVTNMWASQTEFFVKQTLEAFERGELVFEKTMQDSVSRYPSRDTTT